MQAAVGLSQLKKLEYFIEKRRENFNGLQSRIRASGLDRYFILPEATKNTNPSWFALLTLRDDVKISRRDVTAALEEENWYKITIRR